MLNFTIGPVSMDPEIAMIGSREPPYFRGDEFSNIVIETESLVKGMLNATNGSRAIFLTGSGTLAMEASVTNLFSKKDKLLVVNGGTFGARLCEIAICHSIPFDELKLEDGEPLTQGHLDAFRHNSYTGVLINHHETSTGVLYDLDLIKGFCRLNESLLVIDAISSFISDEVDMYASKADALIVSSHKALALPPGLSIVALSSRAIKKSQAQPSGTYYGDFKTALENGLRGQTPFTPAVNIILQLHARLKRISSVGLLAERSSIVEIASDFRERIKYFDFDIGSTSLSNTLTPIMPSSVSAYSLYETLRSNYDILVCPSGGSRKHTLLRVGHIGMLTIADNDKLFFALSDLKNKGNL